MTRTEYRTLRRLVRDNGLFARKWMKTSDERNVFSLLVEKRDDPIADRAELFESMGWGIHLSKSLARGIASQRSFEKPEEIAKYIASNGYRPWFDGRTVHVPDPVYSSRAGKLVLTGHHDVEIRTMTDARRFITARS